MKSPLTPSESRVIGRIALAALLGVLVFGALALYGDLRALEERLREFRWSAFGIALALAFSNYAIRFVRWELYLRQLSIRVPLWESFLLYLSGFLMAITPAKLGEVWRSVLLKNRHDVPLVRSGPIVVAERLTDLLALVLLASFGAVSFRMGAGPIAAGLGLVLAVLVVVSNERLSAASLRLTGRIPWVRRFVPRLAEARESLADLVRPSRLVVPTLLAVAAWFCECVAYLVVLDGFEGVRVGLEPATFVYSVSTIAGAVAMMPGGLGVTELGMTGLVQVLSHGTVDAVDASAATILVRLATLWFAVGLGGLAFLLLPRARRGEHPLGESDQLVVDDRG